MLNVREILIVFDQGVAASPLIAARRQGNILKSNQKSFLTVVVPLIAAWGIAMPFSALGQTAPLSYVASPDVYKLLAENDQFRVIQATWKPGQRDVQHSHSASVAYRLTDCKARLFGPDGKAIGEGESKVGSVNLQSPIGSHAFENIGTTDCQILLVERK